MGGHLQAREEFIQLATQNCVVLYLSPLYRTYLTKLWDKGVGYQSECWVTKVNNKIKGVLNKIELRLDLNKVNKELNG